MEHRFTSSLAKTVPREQWNQIIGLNYKAVAKSYGHRFIQIPYVRLTIGMDGVDEYMKRRQQPVRANNSYADPQIHMAFDERNRISGVAWSALNTSGKSEAERARKMNSRLPHERGVWIGWLATRVDQQHQGLATDLIEYTLSTYRSSHPASAFAWPAPAGSETNVSAVEGPLVRNGFERISDLAVMPAYDPRNAEAPEVPTTAYQRLDPVRAALRTLSSADA